MQHNVLAMSGKAVEAAGDVNTLLLDKTGTITLGNRQAVAFVPAPGVTDAEIADAAQLSSLPDETPEGRSIVVLAKEKYGLRGREIPEDANFMPFSAYTKMSGVDIDGRRLRKGATDGIVAFVKQEGGTVPPGVTEISDEIARSGGTPLAVADGPRLLGIISLKDIVKVGMRERIVQLGHGHPVRMVPAQPAAPQHCLRAGVTIYRAGTKTSSSIKKAAGGAMP